MAAEHGPPAATWRPWWATLIAVAAIVAATFAAGVGVLNLVDFAVAPGAEMASLGLAVAVIGILAGILCGTPFALYLLRGGKPAFVIGTAMLGLVAFLLTQ